jgi:hypothetical protein
MTVTIVPRSTRFARNVQCGVASSRQSCLHRVKVAFHNPTVAARINAICTRMTLTVRSTNHNYKIDAEASALAKTPARPLGLQLFLPSLSAALLVVHTRVGKLARWLAQPLPRVSDQPIEKHVRMSRLSTEQTLKMNTRQMPFVLPCAT